MTKSSTELEKEEGKCVDGSLASTRKLTLSLTWSVYKLEWEMGTERSKGSHVKGEISVLVTIAKQESKNLQVKEQQMQKE